MWDLDGRYRSFNLSFQKAKQRLKREWVTTGEDLPEVDLNEAPWETVLCEAYDEMVNLDDSGEERFETIVAEADQSFNKAAGVESDVVDSWGLTRRRLRILPIRSMRRGVNSCDQDTNAER